jgi:hypothetical protein
VGKADFNEDLAEAEHWKMEDKNAHRDAKSRAAFGGAIKQGRASHNLAVHGKGKKQILLSSLRRLTIRINDDPEYITVLPMLDSSVADKITILKCGKATMLPDWKADRPRFMAELPALVDFLLNVFTIPPSFNPSSAKGPSAPSRGSCSVTRPPAVCSSPSSPKSGPTAWRRSASRVSTSGRSRRRGSSRPPPLASQPPPARPPRSGSRKISKRDELLNDPHGRGGSGVRGGDCGAGPVSTRIQ